MKLRFIIASFAAALMAVACTVEDPISHLEGLEVSNDYITVASDAGSAASITVTGVDAWMAVSSAEWLTVTPFAGTANQTVSVSLTATTAATAARSAEVRIVMGDKVKIILVNQAAPIGTDVPPSKCEDVVNGPDAVYRVTGSVTKITNTHYGNWYINDGTVDGDGVYVYGTLDKKGGDNSSSNSWDNINDPTYPNSWELAVGDVVTIEGPKQVYNGTIELVNVTILKIVKSLLSVEPDAKTVGKEGGNADFKLVYKGNDLVVTPQVDWLKLGGINVGKDSTIVSVTAAPNEGDTRSGTVVISSSIPGQKTEVTVTVYQESGLSMYTIPYVETFANGFGAFEISVDTPRPDGNDIWSTGVYNNVPYAKATAGSAVDTKSMLVSPKISLKGVASPVLTFKHCGKYFGNQQEESTLWVSTDNCVTWTQLLIPEHDNAYGWKDSGDISLARFVGAEYLNLAFQYVSNAAHYGTWEIADVKVEDRKPAFTSIAQLDNAASSAKVAYDVTLTDAVVKYVNGGNAFIEDATGGIQLYLNNHGLTAGQKIDGKANITVTLYNGYAEATGLDLSAASVAEGGDLAPTVLTIDQLLKAYLRYQNCMVELDGVTFDTPVTPSNRNGVISQDGKTINVYAQVKNTLDMNGTGNLICFPTRYNATLQVGVFDNAHFTK